MGSPKLSGEVEVLFEDEVQPALLALCLDELEGLSLAVIEHPEVSAGYCRH